MITEVITKTETPIKLQSSKHDRLFLCDLDLLGFDVVLAISQREPGSQVELEVMRDSESFQTYATLLQQPPLP